MVLLESFGIVLTLVATTSANFGGATNPNHNGGNSDGNNYNGQYSGSPRNKFACDVLAGTNGHRASKGRPALTGDTRLDAASMDQCHKMAALNVLEHETYGTGPAYRIEQQGYKWSGVAENIYNENGYGNPDPTRAVKSWIESPGHEKNMVGDYTQMGSAYCFGNNGKVFWAQNFGKGDFNPSQGYDCQSSHPPSSNSSPSGSNANPSGSNASPSGSNPSPSGNAANSPSASGNPSGSPSGLPDGGYQPPSATTSPSGSSDNSPVRYGPNGRPCVSTGYGKKSLKKRSMKKSSRKTLAKKKRSIRKAF